MNIGERKKAVTNRQRPPSYGHVSFTRTAAASSPHCRNLPFPPRFFSPIMVPADADARQRRGGPLNKRGVRLIRLASGLPPDTDARERQEGIGGRARPCFLANPSKRGRRIQTSIQSGQGEVSRGGRLKFAKILRKETAVAAADALPVRGGHASASPSHTPTISAPGRSKHHATTSQRKRQEGRHTLVTTSHREQL